MSKRRGIILCVVVEGLSQAETARLYGVSRGWVSKLVARYRLEGEAALQPRSRRPKTSPNATPPAVVELIIKTRRTLTSQGLDAGAETICWHLQHHHDVTVSPSTIRRLLHRAKLIEPAPKKRPKTSFIRFEASLPNEMWQTDVCHWRLANGTITEILSFLDDRSRYALSVSAHDHINTSTVISLFRETADQHGYPASVLSDNAMYYTARFARGGASSRNGFETLLNELGVQQKHSRPNHPTTCGKVEKFQQTLKKWLTAQHRANTIDQLQNQLDDFANTYNNHRPHRSIARAVPADIYTQLPKSTPTTKPSTQHRIRHDHVGTCGKVTLRHNGKLHHIGIGRRHAHTPVLMIINNLNIRIINPTTGQLLRKLTLNPTRDYQPQNQT